MTCENMKNQTIILFQVTRILKKTNVHAKLELISFIKIK